MAIRLADRILQLEQRRPATDIDIGKLCHITPERAILIMQEGLRVVDLDSPEAELMRRGIAEAEKELEAAHGQS